MAFISSKYRNKNHWRNKQILTCAFAPHISPLASCSGFTLVEMAMVIVIIGLVMLTVFPALNAVRSSSQISLTQSNLRNLMLATAAYVQANGCVPCPATPGGNTTSFGLVSSPAACGTCASVEGIPPFASMGLPASAAHDGWGHWITMRVDPALTKNFAVTPPTATCQCSDFISTNLPATCTTAQAGTTATPTCTTLNASQKGLCQTGLATTNRISVTTPGGATQKAAVIFVSHGKNGYGSYFAQAAANTNNGVHMPFGVGYQSCNGATGNATIGYAACNAAGTLYFYNAQTVAADSGGADPYDDILTFADRNTLVSMLGNPGCQTVW